HHLFLLFSFFFQQYFTHRALPSFPTRRSSDLVTEAKLAREAEICYATVAMITDYDCWYPGHDSVTVAEVMNNLNRNTENGDHGEDRKSTRLNSSHVKISYAVFCLKKKKNKKK